MVLDTVILLEKIGELVSAITQIPGVSPITLNTIAANWSLFTFYRILDWREQTHIRTTVLRSVKRVAEVEKMSTVKVVLVVIVVLSIVMKETFSWGRQRDKIRGLYDVSKNSIECSVVITARKRSLGQYNVFTPVCRSFCSEGGGERGYCPAQLDPESDTPWTQRQTPPGRDGTEAGGSPECILVLTSICFS